MSRCKIANPRLMMQHTAEIASLSWQPLQPVAFSLQALDVYMLSHPILITPDTDMQCRLR